MTWDIDTAKRRLGIADDDTSQDENIESAMSTALAIAESYCDRRFLKQADEEEFVCPCGPNLLVRRYPLVSLDSLGPLDGAPAPDGDPSAALASWRMDKKRGIVFMMGTGFVIAPVGSTPAPAGTRRGFVLGYTGGYDPLPADLEAALWFTFDSVWRSTPGWGLPAGSGSSGSGAVKSFGIDGMRIDYDLSATAGSTGAGRAEAFGLIPAQAIGILDFYRAESAAIGG